MLVGLLYYYCNNTHKKELLDFKLSTFYFFFQTEQFRNSLVTHRWIDMNLLLFIVIITIIQKPILVCLSVGKTFQWSAESPINTGPGKQGAWATHGSPLCLCPYILEVTNQIISIAIGRRSVV